MRPGSKPRSGLPERRRETLAALGGRVNPRYTPRPMIDRDPAPDLDPAIRLGEALELAELGDVDQEPRLAPPLPEVDEEVGAAAERLRVGVLGEERRRLGERRGVAVLEAREEHGSVGTGAALDGRDQRHRVAVPEHGAVGRRGAVDGGVELEAGHAEALEGLEHGGAAGQVEADGVAPVRASTDPEDVRDGDDHAATGAASPGRPALSAPGPAGPPAASQTRPPPARGRPAWPLPPVGPP